MKLNGAFISFVLLFGMNSCGVITKTRYGNGFKLNIESNLFSKSDDKNTITSKKTIYSDSEIYKKITHDSKQQNSKIDTDFIAIDSTFPITFQNSTKIQSEKISLENASYEYKNLTVYQYPFNSNYNAEMMECDSPDLSTNQISNESIPIEPYTKLAVTIFFISTIVLIATLFLGGLIIIFLVPIFTGFLTSLILAIIGFIRILIHKGKFRGLGRAISVLLLSIFIVLSVLYAWIMSNIVY